MVDILNFKLLSTSFIFYYLNRFIYKKYCKPNNILFNKNLNLDNYIEINSKHSSKKQLKINRENINFIKEIYGENINVNFKINNYLKIIKKDKINYKILENFNKTLNITDCLDKIWIICFCKKTDKIIILNHISNFNEFKFNLNNKFYYESYILKEIKEELFNLDLKFMFCLKFNQNNEFKIFNKIILKNIIENKSIDSIKYFIKKVKDN